MCWGAIVLCEPYLSCFGQNVSQVDLLKCKQFESNLAVTENLLLGYMTGNWTRT